MFKALLTQWRSARGSALLKEVEDLARRTAALAPLVAARFGETTAKTFAWAVASYGPPENMSAQARVGLGKALQAEGRKSFHSDIGKGYAYFLVGAFYEASGTPGEDAKKAAGLSEHFVAMAAKVERQIGDGEEAVGNAVAVAKYMGAASPRFAAEMTCGRPLSDEEWEGCRGPWERHWAGGAGPS